MARFGAFNAKATVFVAIFGSFQNAAGGALDQPKALTAAADGEFVIEHN
jgi:hypothetical protein